MAFIINLGYTTRNGFFETLTDKELVKHDIMTALNITKGECDWDPSFGVSIKEKLFQPKTVQVKNDIENDIKSVFDKEPRVMLLDIDTQEVDKGWVFSCKISYLNGTPEIWEYEYSVNQGNYNTDGKYPLGRL